MVKKQIVDYQLNDHVMSGIEMNWSRSQTDLWNRLVLDELCSLTAQPLPSTYCKLMDRIEQPGHEVAYRKAIVRSHWAKADTVKSGHQYHSPTQLRQIN